MNKNLGKTAKDRVTGFTGIVTGFAQYLTGCDQYLILPSAKKDEKYPDSVWLDDTRLVFSKKTVVVLEGAIKDPGCDTVAPKY